MLLSERGTPSLFGDSLKCFPGREQRKHVHERTSRGKRASISFSDARARATERNGVSFFFSFFVLTSSIENEERETLSLVEVLITYANASLLLVSLPCLPKQPFSSPSSRVGWLKPCALISAAGSRRPQPQPQQSTKRGALPPPLSPLRLLRRLLELRRSPLLLLLLLLPAASFPAPCAPSEPPSPPKQRLRCPLRPRTRCSR